MRKGNKVQFSEEGITKVQKFLSEDWLSIYTISDFSGVIGELTEKFEITWGVTINAEKFPKLKSLFPHIREDQFVKIRFEDIKLSRVSRTKCKNIK